MTNILILILSIILQSPIDTSCISYQPPTVTSACQKVSAATSAIKPQDNLLADWTEQHEPLLWQELDSLTPEMVHAAQKKYEQSYIQMYEKKYARMQPLKLSADLEKVITLICADFGMERSSLQIRKNTGFSPAAATDSFLLINEAAFNEYPKEVWPFMIAHELQHIINKDGSTYHALERLTSNKTELNTFRRFCEMRADMGAISKGTKYAQGARDFFSHFLSEYDEEQGSAHPKIKTRLRLANNALSSFGLMQA